MSNKFAALLCVLLFCLAGCAKTQVARTNTAAKTETSTIEDTAKIANPGKVVHVLVALCDNKYQGIVPVPAFLGNGEDAQKNLYWGAAFGVKTFFSKSANWTKLAYSKSEG